MSDSPYPSDQQDKFMLRLPSGMRSEIKSLAEKNKRSMNAEIVARLDESLKIENTNGFRATINVGGDGINKENLLSLMELVCAGGFPVESTIIFKIEGKKRAQGE